MRWSPHCYGCRLVEDIASPNLRFEAEARFLAFSSVMIAVQCSRSDNLAAWCFAPAIIAWSRPWSTPENCRGSKRQAEFRHLFMRARDQGTGIAVLAAS
jgi:hypothetical protein